MPATEQFSITLPLDMAHLVRAKVAAGDYASESDVVRDGLESLLARDRQINDWLLEVVGPAFRCGEYRPFARHRYRSRSRRPRCRGCHSRVKTYRVVFTPEAQQQLIDLRRFIGRAATPAIARRYTAAIVDHCETLASLPFRGTKRDEIRPVCARSAIAAARSSRSSSMLPM